MRAVEFPQANANFRPPEGYAESQVRTVPAYQSTVARGSCEGVPIVVVAWKLEVADIEKLTQNGAIIYLSCLGGLQPHFMTCTFEEATNPA